MFDQPHAPVDANRGGIPPEVLNQMNPRGRKNRKVVITIKQQAADGTMIPVNPLERQFQTQNAMPMQMQGLAPVNQQQTQANGQTVFRAQVQVDAAK